MLCNNYKGKISLAMTVIPLLLMDIYHFEGDHSNMKYHYEKCIIKYVY